MFSEQSWAGLLLVLLGCVDITFAVVVTRPGRTPQFLFFTLGVLIILVGIDNFLGGIQ